ncbi:hypothetical protein GCM10009857_10270 [Agromyces soli]
MRGRMLRTAALAAAGAVLVGAAATSASTAALAAEPLVEPGEVPIVAESLRGGTFLPAVEVQVGERTLTLLLDTGSEGLVVYPNRLEGDTTVERTEVVADPDYNGAHVFGHVALADVTIGGTPPARLPFVLAHRCEPVDCLGGDDGLDGILGVSQGLRTWGDGGETPYPWWSAIAQLPDGAGDGHTIRIEHAPTVPGERIGTLTLGAPLAGEADAVFQPALTGGGDYPGSDHPMYAKQVESCWSIDTTMNCLPTTVDSGERGSVLMGDFGAWATPVPSPTPFPGGGDEEIAHLNAGTPISFAVPGQLPFWTRTVADGYRAAGLYQPTPPPSGEADADADAAALAASGPYFNTGNVFFVGRSIGFDNLTGRIVVGPVAGLPAAVQQVSLTEGDRRVEVGWTDTQPGVESYVVRLKTAVGEPLEERVVLGAPSPQTFTGVADGVDVVAEVAAANAAGVGPWLASPNAARFRPHLPETGPETLGPALIGVLLGGAGLLLLGARVVIGFHRRRATSP